MEEEKKEEKVDQKPVENKVEPPQEVKASPEQANKVEKPVVAAPKRERPSNCAGCNKSIKKKRWYYRNGKYYCTKRCWKNTLKKDAKDTIPAK